jgi:hypothetical protein
VASRAAPAAGRGLIVQDFAFHGNSAANTLLYFRDHGPGLGGAGTSRTERARARLAALAALFSQRLWPEVQA